MDPITIAITLLTIVISIPIGFYIGRRNRQVPDLRSAVDFDAVLEPGEWLTRGDLDINFDGKKLTRVSRTYLALWNHRGDTVMAADVLPSDPLRITVEDDDEILQTRVVSLSRLQIAPDVTPGGKGAMLTFTFLDPGDGFIVEVMHRGTSAARLEGTVPGAAIRPSKKFILTRRARHRMRQAWPKRLLQRVKDNGRVFVFLLAGFLFFVGYAIVTSTQTLMRAFWPSLADSDEYDLTSLAGQRDFSDYVRALGEPALLSVILAWVNLAIAVLALVLILRLLLTPGVPRSIARNDAESYDDPTDPE